MNICISAQCMLNVQPATDSSGTTQAGNGVVLTRVKLNTDTDSIHLLQVYFVLNDT